MTNAFVLVPGKPRLAGIGTMGWPFHLLGWSPERPYTVKDQPIFQLLSQGE